MRSTKWAPNTPAKPIMAAIQRSRRMVSPKNQAAPSMMKIGPVNPIAVMSAKRQEHTVEEHKRRLESIGLKPDEAIRKVEEMSTHLQQLRAGAATVNKRVMGLEGDRAVKEAEDQALDAEEEAQLKQEVQQARARAPARARPVEGVTKEQLMAMRAAIQSGGGPRGAVAAADGMENPREQRRQPAAT